MQEQLSSSKPSLEGGRRRDRDHPINDEDVRAAATVAATEIRVPSTTVASTFNFAADTTDMADDDPGQVPKRRKTPAGQSPVAASGTRASASGSSSGSDRALWRAKDNSALPTDNAATTQTPKRTKKQTPNSSERAAAPSSSSKSSK